MTTTPMAADLLLDVQNLQTGFALREGYVKAVDGASFSVKRGETIGIVGESGCGKSITARTILRIAGTFDSALGGKIFIARQAATWSTCSSCRMPEKRSAASAAPRSP